MRLKIIVSFVLLCVFADASLAQHKVLVELFGNTGCAPCKQADEGYEAFMKSNPGLGIVRINYHNNFPAPADIFYPGKNSAVDFREGASYYNFVNGGDPWGFFNGVDGGFNESAWESTTSSEAANNISQIAANAYYGSDGLIHIHFTNTATPGLAVRANVALTESNILYNNPDTRYGNPSSGHWDDIFRTMLPGPQGSTPFVPTGSDDITYTLDPATAITKGVNWNFQNMQAIVWLQDDQGTTRHIRALGTVSLASLAAVASERSADAPHIVLASNPVFAGSHIGFYLSTADVARLVIRDMAGREVLSFGGTRAASGSTEIDPDWSHLASGVYLAELEVAGRTVDHCKLLIEP